MDGRREGLVGRREGLMGRREGLLEGKDGPRGRDDSILVLA